MDNALWFPCLPFCLTQTSPPSPTCRRRWKKLWMRRRRGSSCWNAGGSDARWQRSEWRAGSILISTPSRCGSTQQAVATVALCPGVGSHLLPRWIHHALLLLHVSCDVIHLISLELHLQPGLDNTPSWVCEDSSSKLSIDPRHCKKENIMQNTCKSIRWLRSRGVIGLFQASVFYSGTLVPYEGFGIEPVTFHSLITWAAATPIMLVAFEYFYLFF